MAEQLTVVFGLFVVLLVLWMIWVVFWGDIDE